MEHIVATPTCPGMPVSARPLAVPAGARAWSTGVTYGDRAPVAGTALPIRVPGAVVDVPTGGGFRIVGLHSQKRVPGVFPRGRPV